MILRVLNVELRINFFYIHICKERVILGYTLLFITYLFG